MWSVSSCQHFHFFLVILHDSVFSNRRGFHVKLGLINLISPIKWFSLTFWLHLGESIGTNPGYLKLRKIRAAQAIARTVKKRNCFSFFHLLKMRDLSNFRLPPLKTASTWTQILWWSILRKLHLTRDSKIWRPKLRNPPRNKQFSS